jgi:hypothetical protein
MNIGIIEEKIMSYLEMSEEEIHDCVERGGLDDDMFFSLHEDAKARIQLLESVVRSFVEWKTDDLGLKSLVDDEVLWFAAEKVLNDGI